MQINTQKTRTMVILNSTYNTPCKKARQNNTQTNKKLQLPKCNHRRKCKNIYKRYRQDIGKT